MASRRSGSHMLGEGDAEADHIIRCMQAVAKKCRNAALEQEQRGSK